VKPRLFAHDLKDGTIFVALNRGDVHYPMWGGMQSEDELRGEVGRLWAAAYDAKRPEIERLQRNDLLYQGHHFNIPSMNRQSVIPNLCFSTTETVVSDYIQSRPRPEPVPRRAMDRGRADRIAQFAQHLMDMDGFDYAFVQGARSKFKHGWNVTLVCFDQQSGMPYPKPWSVHDFYRDPAATSEENLEYFFLGTPVATRLLRQMFPKAAGEIQPDGIASPSYEAFVRPRYEMMRGSASNVISSVLSFSTGSGPLPSTTTKLIGPEGGGRVSADTTFLLQMFARDRTRIPVPYSGELVDKQTGARVPAVVRFYWEPLCESGWCCTQLTAGGKVLDSSPVDSCYDGMPVVFGRDYDLRPDYFEGLGEIDNIYSLNRSITRRMNLLNRSLEYEALPLLVIDRDAGADIDKNALGPGDRISKTRGSELKWLDFRGVSQHQFELLAMELRLLEMVSGVSDVQYGRRPAGIEAAAAIRELRSGARVRITAKESSMLRELSHLLKKLMVCAGKKLNRRYFFQSTRGEPTWIDPEELLDEYSIRFAIGTASVASRLELEERALGLFQAGLIDQEAALQDIDYRGREEVVARMRAQQMQEMQFQMAMAEKASKNGGGAGQPSRNPAEARR